MEERMMKRMVDRVMRAVLAGMLGLGLALTGAALPAAAQADLFAPAVTVNGTVVTRYEVKQRIAFLNALHQPGDIAQLAMDGLISDRLQQDAAHSFGITVAEPDVTAGMAEFAGRANMATEDFLKALAESEVQPETFRDFVKAGVLWRAVLRAKFGGRIHVSDAEVDRAIAMGAASGGAKRVLLSEIVLPDDGKSDVTTIAQRIKDHVKNADDFALQAKLFSKVNTAADGGVLGWVDVTALPPDVVAAIAALKPGEMTPPIPQQGAVALYFLRDQSEGEGTAKGASTVDYAVFQPSTATDLARLQASISGCEQLNVQARGMPAAALQRQTSPEASVPLGLRAAMSGLDAGESAVVTGANGAAQLLMICARRPASAVEPSADDVRSQLVNRRLTMLAQAYLEELRSQAIIVRQ